MRYFFHLCDGITKLLDPEGRELEAEDVPAITLGEARAIIAADAKEGHIYLDQRIEVLNGAGELIHRLQFEDALRITHRAVNNH